MHEEVPWDTSQENIARTQFYKSDIISVAAIPALIKSLVIERKIPTYEQCDNIQTNKLKTTTTTKMFQAPYHLYGSCCFLMSS